MNPECDEVTERYNNIEEFDDYTISRWFPRDEELLRILRDLLPFIVA